MQKMSGTDLHFAVAELARLQGKRIAKVRKTESGIFLFKIGTEELLFEPGVRLHLTRQVMQAAGAPDGFVGLLRKSLEGKTAAKIEQHGNDRILEITAKSKERLVFELFRKGNLILVGEDGMIYACLLKDEAGGRKVARGEKYNYPKATPYEAKIPKSASFTVQENDKAEPVSFSCESPAGKIFPSFSEMADYYYANQKEKSDGEKAALGRLSKLQERLGKQKEALVKLQLEKEQMKKLGDAVYGDYERVEKLLLLVRGMKKQGKGDEEINRALAPMNARISGAEIEIEA